MGNQTARQLVAALVLIAAPASALAQAGQCTPPARIERPRLEGPSDQEPRRNLPIGRYTLALSWSPQFCANAPRGKRSFQCSGGGGDGRGRFGFTLHGLWPDGYGRQWSQYCRPAALLPRAVIARNLCATPSAQLIQHEWAKHGTCMTTRPDAYFNLSRAFYRAIRYPDMTALAADRGLTAGTFALAFARANKGMSADMVRVTTTRGNRLSEVWLCMDRAMALTACPRNAGGARAGASLRIQPGPAVRNLRQITEMPADPARRPGWLPAVDPDTPRP